VHAATKEEKKEEKVDVLWTEFGCNDVYRRFELAHPIDADKVTAQFDQGMLRIDAPEIVEPKAAVATGA